MIDHETMNRLLDDPVEAYALEAASIAKRAQANVDPLGWQVRYTDHGLVLRIPHFEDAGIRATLDPDSRAITIRLTGALRCSMSGSHLTDDPGPLRLDTVEAWREAIAQMSEHCRSYHQGVHGTSRP